MKHLAELHLQKEMYKNNIMGSVFYESQHTSAI